jgi:phage shock protein PspC (stress-responsive transcriptional regulator)
MDGRIFCKSCLEKGAHAPAPAEGYESHSARPLQRSRSDRMIAGLCAPIAERMGLDPTLVRVLWLLLALFTGSILAWVYIVMWIVIPQEP